LAGNCYDGNIISTCVRNNRSTCQSKKKKDRSRGRG
jgi:hypothetical protein